MIKWLRINRNNAFLEIAMFYKARKFSENIGFLQISLMLCLREGIHICISASAFSLRCYFG